MAYRRTPFALNEWYHCFSRGIDKRVVFDSRDDFRRFQQLLYLANNIDPIERGNFYHMSHAEIFRIPRTQTIVAIGAYCLMDNHPHLLMQEKVEGGISKFMHKVGTGYTMYYNTKNDRIGNLMVKPFRSKHVASDDYLRWAAQYIHLNSAELFEHDWKHGLVRNIRELERKLVAYEYSSLRDYYLDDKRIERKILDPEAMALISADMPSLAKTLFEMSAYYAELEKEF